MAAMAALSQIVEATDQVWWRKLHTAAHCAHGKCARVVLGRNRLVAHKYGLASQTSCRCGQCLRGAVHLVEFIWHKPKCLCVGYFVPVIGAYCGGGENTGGNV